MSTRSALGLLALSVLLSSCTDQVLDPRTAHPPLNGPAFTLVGPVTDISAGRNHTCAIGAGGAISCWGFEGVNIQDAIDALIDSGYDVDCTQHLSGPCYTPVPAGSFTQVSAGLYHACALGTNGAVSCWGYNLYGQTDAPSGSFTQVSAGDSHTCALGTDGAITCWGYNPRRYSQVRSPAGTFTQVSVGSSYTCAISTGGAIGCWLVDGTPAFAPSGSFTQVSPGGCALDTEGAIHCWFLDSPSGSFTQVSRGSSHACGIETDGAIRCWGANGAGQANAPSGTFTKVSAGTSHTCAIRTNGTPECWGSDVWSAASIMQDRFTQVSAGEDYTCALRSGGTIKCWGGGHDGWVGTNVPSGSFTQLSAGYFHACAVGIDGAISCWGSNNEGQANPPSGSFAQVSVGGYHTCALGTDGAISCWGYNHRGQTNAPTGRFTQISAAGDRSCAIRTDAGISCWGHPVANVPDGSFTQVSAAGCALGTDGAIRCWEERLSRLVKLEIPSGSFTELTVGGDHACAIRTDTTISCWGYNSWGQMKAPNGSFTNVSASVFHTCAIRIDQTFECWGRPAATSFVTVFNEAPVVPELRLPTGAVPLTTSASIRAAFTDRNPADVHVATIDWGDGTTSSGVVTEADGAGTVEGSHTYSRAGLFTVLVTVSDGALEGSRSSSSDDPAYVVVYDPSAGFVTGSGWFDSPIGACSWSGCAADGGTTGKASFDFNARYQKNATSPKGTVRFQLAGSTLSLESVSHEWLVVAGARAHLKGTGTINGAGDYAFLVSTVDGKASGGGADRFRIRIWDRATGASVYDNEPGVPDDATPATETGGGNITLHIPKM